jgi:hypothetical protein
VSRLYVYKVRYDDGTAPCVEDGVLTLALCKPAIRATAAVGDTLVGFAAKSMCRDQRLVYAAVVTARVEGGAYYRERRWRRRRDCAYAWRGGAFVPRGGTAAAVAPEDLRNDLGAPPAYVRANVLVSDNYRYFAETRPADYREEFPQIARFVDALGQGHRVNLGERLRDEFERYLAALWHATRSIAAR